MTGSRGEIGDAGPVSPDEGGRAARAVGGDARQRLLAEVVEDLARHGIGHRSLREIAASVGTSHRMLLYHFGSREGLVAAVVGAVEADQRATLRALAEEVGSPGELVMALWARVCSPELRPFVRLFFETVAAGVAPEGDGVPEAGAEMTRPWLEDSDEVAAVLGTTVDPVEVRLGIAVTRGLLIDVLATGEVGPATASLERFVELWEGGR